MSKPESLRMLQKAVTTKTAGDGQGTARGGSSTARGNRTARGSARRGEGPPVGQIVVAGAKGKPVGAAPGSASLLQVRREFEDKLALEKQAIKKREEELEEQIRFHQQSEHTKAEIEKTKDLTKLRQAQQRKLLEHDRMLARHRSDAFLFTILCCL